mgnify:CR=1 FL=1
MCGTNCQNEANPPAEGCCKPDENAPSETEQILGPVARAEAELKRAKEAYDRVCDEATRRLRDVREAKVGDLCDGVLEQVKRHPGPSLCVAAVLGFFLGRLFRR